MRGTTAAAALAAVLAVSVAQVATAAVLPAVSRTLGLADWQAGAVTSLSAAVVVLTSRLWGRVADRRGPLPVVLAGATAGVVGTLLVAAVTAAGALPDAAAWVLLLLGRGVVFGVAAAAVGPAVQAFGVAGADDAGRVAWLARGGAARGLGTAVGAALAASLGAVAVTLPVLVTAGVLVAAGGAFALAVRRSPARAPTAAAAAGSPAPGRPPRPATLRVPGVRAAVLSSAAVFLALSLVQSTVGFLVQDRYGLAAERATALTGTLLLMAGLGSVVSQGVLVPRLRWAPRRLVVAGGGVLVASVAVYALPVPAPVLAAVALAFGAGGGAAAAGCTSAAAAAVGPDAQGDVAGAVNAVNALTFVLGPLLGTTAYGLHPALPAAGALAVGAVLLVPGRSAR
jgi:MFS family permease